MCTNMQKLCAAFSSLHAFCRTRSRMSQNAFASDMPMSHLTRACCITLHHFAVLVVAVLAEPAFSDPMLKEIRSGHLKSATTVLRAEL